MEQQELDEKIQQLRASMEAEQQSMQNAEKWIELIRRYTNITELTADLLNALIEKITVHEATDFICNMAVRSVGNLYAEMFIRLLLCVVVADALLVLIYFWTNNFKFVMSMVVDFVKSKFKSR